MTECPICGELPVRFSSCDVNGGITGYVYHCDVCNHGGYYCNTINGAEDSWEQFIFSNII